MKRYGSGAVWVGILSLASVAMAQQSLPPGTGDSFKDTAMLKPPAGARVAIIEFQDLECPACAHAFPIVHQAVDRYHIPLEEKDFPLQMHIWSYDAAIWARYLQDKVSPKVADEYRGAVFAAQTGIASKDDMLAFTRQFFEKHGLQMPFVPDPTGALAAQVKAERAQGEKLGVQKTPTIIVCNPHEWIQVTNPDQLYQAIDQLEARAGSETGTSAPARRSSSAKSSQ